MSWRETERDDTKRVPLIVLRCTGCGRRAVTTSPYAKPSACCCGAKP